MPESKGINLNSFLENPEVKKVITPFTDDFQERLDFQPQACKVFSNPATRLESDLEYEFDIHPATKEALPNIIANTVQRVIGIETPDSNLEKNYTRQRNIGIVFSGGPAPGGHNVIAGLYDAMKKANPENRLLGFIMGPEGILEKDFIELDETLIKQYRNRGGFSMIKTGRTKIDTKEKMALARENCKEMNLDAIVIVGGDDSNTNAAFLAQELINDGIQVLGVPKTIDGDVQVKDKNNKILCAISFGFHTAARAFAQNISNLCSDSSSDVKYWHVCKVMGRVASHLALEVALQVHPNMCMIGEEMADYIDSQRQKKAEASGVTDYTAFGMTLRHLSRVICNTIVRRAEAGKNYGVIVIPEGILEFINEIQIFIIKLNTIIAEYNQTHDTDFHSDFITLEEKINYLRRMARFSRENNGIFVWNTRDDDLFSDIPAFFQEGLLTERDSHGNFQFSQVETEKVILGLVQDYLKIRQEEGRYKIGIKPEWFDKTLKKEGFDPDYYGPVIFKNYKTNEPFLLSKDALISIKTLNIELVRKRIIGKNDDIPPVIQKVFQATIPKFKTQVHFYGYDGRGNDPTWFDCTYTYNLGLTAFSLIANNASGQMAAIQNLEKDFDDWEPIGIPIAPLMHLEERKGKLALVIERAVVELDSPAFKVVEQIRENWIADNPGPDQYRNPGPIRFSGRSVDRKPLILTLNNLGEKG
ncbi:MAG: 6-phosphofructokinase [Desulfobacteraceae bacterium]|jgi:pyrophosphate--fructose-6-phosphate 1-phosphotransferase|nr:6-phosphofructokinase [Desulfobacteraceae bacterium]